MYRLTVLPDHDAENPNNEDTLFHVHSFSNRHINFTDPNNIDFDETPGFMLSYFEHGRCLWGLEGTMSGMPDFRWDGVRYAGFLEVLDGNDWFLNESDEKQRSIAEAHMEYYTAWSNGDTYGYIFEEVSVEECDLGYEHESVRHIDTCFGFVGDDHLVDHVRHLLKHYEVEESDLEVVDEAYSAADTGLFYPLEKDAA